MFLIQLLFQSPIYFVVIGASLIIAITIHEFAHAFMADRLGDPNPRADGRVSLNPVAHLDPLGTLAMLFIGFGWGKPVVFDPYNLNNYKRDTLLIALAGPASNLILATLLAILIQLISPLSLITALLAIIIEINVMLAIFNLLPIPPLDGSRILSSLLPNDQSAEFEAFSSRYSTLLLLFFLMPIVGGRSLASTVIDPIIALVMNILL